MPHCSCGGAGAPPGGPVTRPRLLSPRSAETPCSRADRSRSGAGRTRARSSHPRSCGYIVPAWPSALASLGARSLERRRARRARRPARDLESATVRIDGRRARRGLGRRARRPRARLEAAAESLAAADGLKLIGADGVEVLSGRKARSAARRNKIYGSLDWPAARWIAKATTSSSGSSRREATAIAAGTAVRNCLPDAYSWKATQAALDASRPLRSLPHRDASKPTISRQLGRTRATPRLPLTRAASRRASERVAQRAALLLHSTKRSCAHAARSVESLPPPDVRAEHAQPRRRYTTPPASRLGRDGRLAR